MADPSGAISGYTIDLSRGNTWSPKECEEVKEKLGKTAAGLGVVAGVGSLIPGTQGFAGVLGVVALEFAAASVFMDCPESP